MLPSASRRSSSATASPPRAPHYQLQTGRRDRRPADGLPRPARVRVGLHGADRRRGGLQRRARVRAAEEPQRRDDAARSWALLATTMFAGITALALLAHVHMAEDPAALIGLPAGEPAEDGAQPDRRSRRSGRRLPFYLLQGVHRGDPDPRREHRLQRLPGARPRCSAATTTCRTSSPTAATGSSSRTASCCSALVAALLIVAFNAEVTRLIQLYILGVFLSFTLSQAGMVRHWARADRRRRRARAARCAASRRSTRRRASSPGSSS